MTLKKGVNVEIHCGIWTLRVLKYLNFLHELCATTTAAALAADQWSKLQ